MSLIVVTYVPEGIVMASDSRQSLTIGGKTPDGRDFKVETVNSDAVMKTFLLEKQKVGISYVGQDLLGGIPVAGHVKRFSEEIIEDSDDVKSIAKKITEFVSKKWEEVNIRFHVCGYKKEDKVSVPYVFYCSVGSEPSRKNAKKDGSLAYGSTWSGQADIINGLINPIVITDQQGNKKVVKPAAPVAWEAMPLQDAIDFSIFAIRTTIDTIRFQARPKTVGGPIDVLVLTPDSCKWIQKKEFHA